MRISINLATQPFVELRPLFARLRIAMAALAVLAVGLAIGLHAMSVKAQAAEARMDALKQQTLAVQTERQTNEKRMQQPVNHAVLERSHYLNALFTRKSFSWTSVMMDLESVLPTGVAVTSIEPAVTAEGDVNIRLRVAGDRDRSVDLLRHLEQSKRFLEPRPANETAQTQEGKNVALTSAAAVPGGVEFNILSGYNPLPPMTEEQLAKEQAAKDKAGTGPAHKAAPKAASGAKTTSKTAGPKAAVKATGGGR